MADIIVGLALLLAVCVVVGCLLGRGGGSEILGWPDGTTRKVVLHTSEPLKLTTGHTVRGKYCQSQRWHDNRWVNTTTEPYYESGI